jgi:uncharacterized protein YegJ (DUF2314 family)
VEVLCFEEAEEERTDNLIRKVVKLNMEQIRVRQTGKNSNGCDHLIVNAIEFFGVLKAPKH